MDDHKAIACNVLRSTSAVSYGAIAYLFSQHGDLRYMLLARSRGGRFVRSWFSLIDLDNWRVKTVPPESPLYKAQLDCGENAAEVAEALQRASDDLREKRKRRNGG